VWSSCFGLILRLAVLLTQVEIVQGCLEHALKPALHRRQRGRLVIEMIDKLRTKIRAWAGLGFSKFCRIEKSWLGSRRLAVMSLFAQMSAISRSRSSVRALTATFWMLSINAVRSI